MMIVKILNKRKTIGIINFSLTQKFKGELLLAMINRRLIIESKREREKGVTFRCFQKFSRILKCFRKRII